jgi:pimeloyl-ACP methyl ester carboxylesterase
MRLFTSATVAMFALASCSYLPEFTPGSLNPGTEVSETREAIVLQKAGGPLHATGFMFYPGGLADPHAYLPWLADLAAAGVPVIVAKAPGNLAVLAPDAGLALRALLPGASGWVIGGHSLGGAMAAWSAHDNPDVWKGIVFLAAYPPDTKSLSAWPHPVLSLSASNDGLATPAEINATLPLLPPQHQQLTALGQPYNVTTGGYAVLHQIAGGVHAQFGSYGAQAGDGTPTISAADQHAEMVSFVVEFFQKNGWLP